MAAEQVSVPFSWVSWQPLWPLQSLDKKAINRNIVIGAIFLTIYVINRFFIKSVAPDNIVGDIIRFHFNDYLGGIVFLAYINGLISCLHTSIKRIESFKNCVLCGIVCSFFWEGLAPLFLPYSTADIRDCLAYVLGSITYWLILICISNFDKLTDDI